MKLREQWKALTAGVVAGLSALVTALADASVIAQEWAVVGLAAATAYAAVWRVPQRGTMPHLSAEELLELAQRAAEREAKS